jgi:hypothetical protein
LIEWFVDPTEPINLGLLYVPEPDETEHHGDIYGEVETTTIKLQPNVHVFIAARNVDSSPVRQSNEVFI